MACFDADAKGHLIVSPFNRLRDLRVGTPIPSKIYSKPFLPGLASITEVSFCILLEGVAHNVRARVASTARPGDLLLRTGHHVFAHPDRVGVAGHLRQDSRWLPGVSYNEGGKHNEMAGMTSEHLVVARWTGPGLFKIVGQGHIIACELADDHCSSVSYLMCLSHTTMEFALIYLLMSKAAALLL